MSPRKPVARSQARLSHLRRLLEFADRDEPMEPVDLAAAMGVAPSTAHQWLSRLEREGLAESELVPRATTRRGRSRKRWWRVL